GQPQLLGHLCATGAVEGQSSESPQCGGLKLLFHQVQHAAEQVAVVFLVPLPVQVAVGVRDLLQGRRGAATPAGRGAGDGVSPVVVMAAANDGANPGADSAAVAGVLKAGEVLDQAQEYFLTQVVQIDRRHTLAIEPADNQRTIEVGQVLPGVLFAGLSAE